MVHRPFKGSLAAMGFWHGYAFYDCIIDVAGNWLINVAESLPTIPSNKYVNR